MTAIVKVGTQYLNLDQITRTEWEDNPRRLIVNFTSRDLIILPAGSGAILERELEEARNTYAKVQEAAYCSAIVTLYKENHP